MWRAAAKRLCDLLAHEKTSLTRLFTSTLNTFCSWFMTMCLEVSRYCIIISLNHANHSCQEDEDKIRLKSRSFNISRSCFSCQYLTRLNSFKASPEQIRVLAWFDKIFSQLSYSWAAFWLFLGPSNRDASSADRSYVEMLSKIISLSAWSVQTPFFFHGRQPESSISCWHRHYLALT